MPKLEFGHRVIPVIPTVGRNLGMRGTTPPQIPHRPAHRNDMRHLYLESVQGWRRPL